MGGGNRKPSSQETSEADAEDFSSRFTDATEETQQNVEDYDDVDEDEDGPLQEFEEDSEDGGIPDFEEFRKGEASLPSDDEGEDDEEAVESTDDAGAASAGAAAGGGASLDAPTPPSDPEQEAESGSSGRGVDQYDVDVPDEVVDANGAGDFATTMFSSGAVADRHLKDQADGEVRATDPEDDADGRLGGWSEFDEDNVTRWLSLKAAGGEAGVTKDYMEVAELRGEDADSYRAYLTNYDHGDKHSRAPEMWQAHSQMAAYAFTDSLGVRVPDHTYDQEEGYVAVAGVETPSRASTEPAKRVPREAAEQVDSQEFVDIMATQVLAGNADLHGENVRIGEDGQVHCIDYDRAKREYGSLKDLERNCRKASRTAETIDRRRDSYFDVSNEDVVRRAQEIAVGLEESGETERVVESVAQYDQVFSDETGRRMAERIRVNIEVAAASARKE